MSAAPSTQGRRQNNSSVASQDPTTELSREIDELLNKLTDKFSVISTELFAKMDEMASRLDNLEASLRAVENEAAEAKSE